MARTKVYQVKDNRIRFKCDACGAKRSVAIPPTVRFRSVKCHKCSTFSRCGLNRRLQRRMEQRGKALMILSSGKEISIDLNDISPRGVGVNVAPGVGRQVSLREQVQFKCNWNPTLFSQGRFVVKSIKGDRIGIENVVKKGW
ncbi:MAG: hypothetical protein V2I36_08980 [Desulfopila sp.]|nr:hypothetical protein [Desulfopila sp.]